MKKHTTNLIIGLVLLILSVPSFCSAYEEKRALANLSHDYTICSAYYIILGTAFANDSDNIEIADNAKKSFLFSYEMAINTALAAGNNAKVVQARLIIANDEMFKAIDYNTGNIIILGQKHGLFCKDLLEDPTERLNYWLNK